MSLLRRGVLLAGAASGVGVMVFGLGRAREVFKISPRPERWGSFSIQGHREYQEDRAFADSHLRLFAVFDGHGGPLASETAAKTCRSNFLSVFGVPDAGVEEARQSIPFVGILSKMLSGAEDVKKSGVRQTTGPAAPLRPQAPTAVPWLELFKSLESSYKEASAGVADSKGSKRGEGREGSTACMALIRDGILSVANAGDSRCVLCEKNGKAFAMSVDHKPDDKDELARLTREGFKVVRGRIYEVSTNKGGLNLSRALGDFHYGNGVTCEPDVVEKKITSDDALLILGTDGLWDVVSNETACQLALAEQGNPTAAAKKLVMHAFQNESQDNITAVVVRLS